MSSLTGTFSGSITNAANDYASYPFTYSIPVANTWTKIVITIPGDTAGTWVMSGKRGGADVVSILAPARTFVVAASAWAAGEYVGATGAVSVVAH